MENPEIIKKERHYYNIEFLESFCKNNNITLSETYTKTNKKTIITGTCIDPNCNKPFTKKFECLVKTNAYCPEHAKIHAREKFVQTCLDRYGSETPMHNDAVKEKIQQTCMNRYGVAHAFQSNAVKDKIKETCLERYGSEYYSQTDEYKEKSKQTFLNHYGVENPFQSKECKEKGRQTLLERYGAENPMYVEEFKDKIKQTCMERYGVENTFQSEECKEKGKQTCIERYGVDYAQQNKEIKSISKQTCLERYGVENPFQNEDIKNKIRQTCINRYGVKHPLQNPTIMEKSIKNSYKLKNYTLPSGIVINYQGFENFALDELLRLGISETDIINGCQNMPEIWYMDNDGIKRRHYVDIFIPSQNRCIEVKSTWAAEKDIDFIFLKQKAGKDLGYLYEIWIYDGNGNKVECHN